MRVLNTASISCTCPLVLFLLMRNFEVSGKRVQTQRCKVPSPTLCVLVTCIRSRSGRTSIAPFPMQNIVAKTTQQRTIARDDISLMLTLTTAYCRIRMDSSLLDGTSVRELISTGIRDTFGDEVVNVNTINCLAHVLENSMAVSGG
jgi:hypothetical protein